MKPLYLSTTSKIKLLHYTEFFAPKGFEIVSLSLDIPEMQSIEPDKVAQEKLGVAQSLTNQRPLLVDDVGLNVPSLMGFPGALLKPILELGGLHLLRDLLSAKIQNHRIVAEFVCAIAVDTGHTCQTVTGTMLGHLNFENETYLSDKATMRCFYPEGQTQSISELQQIDPSLGFKHRFAALEQLLPKL